MEKGLLLTGVPTATRVNLFLNRRGASRNLGEPCVWCPVKSRNALKSKVKLSGVRSTQISAFRSAGMP